MGQLFIPQVTAGRNWNCFCLQNSRENMVDIDFFCQKRYIRANVFIPLEDMDLRLSDKAD